MQMSVQEQDELFDLCKSVKLFILGRKENKGGDDMPLLIAMVYAVGAGVALLKDEVCL